MKMAVPLFTEQELAEHKDRCDAVWKEWRGGSNKRSWEECSAESEALRMAFRVETARRIEQRAEEFLNGLLVSVGSRGTKYVDFHKAFSESDTEEMKNLVLLYNTPESRRTLYTILRALTEVPTTWGRSAFMRFLRSTGKQKGKQYHGAGALGADYGWIEDEVRVFCYNVADAYSPYAKVLMSYADVEKEIREVDPDFEVADYTAKFAGTRAERNIPFIEKLCTLLEEQGLADVPIPKEKSPQKERVPKVFKTGDVIRRNTLRDLPLPAHVRIPIEKLDEGSGQWLPSHMEQVVTVLGKQGHYIGLPIANDGKAYEGWYDWHGKDWLEGAIYLGPWNGEIMKGKELRIKFKFRRPGSRY